MLLMLYALLYSVSRIACNNNDLHKHEANSSSCSESCDQNYALPTRTPTHLQSIIQFPSISQIMVYREIIVLQVISMLNSTFSQRGIVVTAI